MKWKALVPRLREPVARGSQEAGLTQPRNHSFAQPCIQGNAVTSSDRGNNVCVARTSFVDLSFVRSDSWNFVDVVANAFGIDFGICRPRPPSLSHSLSALSIRHSGRQETKPFDNFTQKISLTPWQICAIRLALGCRNPASWLVQVASSRNPGPISVNILRK